MRSDSHGHGKYLAEDCHTQETTRGPLLGALEGVKQLGCNVLARLLFLGQQ